MTYINYKLQGTFEMAKSLEDSMNSLREWMGSSRRRSEITFHCHGYRVTLFENWQEVASHVSEDIGTAIDRAIERAKNPKNRLALLNKELKLKEKEIERNRETISQIQHTVNTIKEQINEENKKIAEEIHEE